MKIHRERRDSCLIEAGALDLDNGSHWQPWLRLVRTSGGVCASHTFDGLKPLFASERAALQYAAELGRSLVDEASVLAPASCGAEIAKWPLNQASAQPCTSRTRVRSFVAAKLTFSLTR